MSSTNGKKPAVSTSESASETTTGTSDTALVQSPAPAAPEATAAPKADEFHGRGGMYTVINGVRQLVGRTTAKHEVQKG
ncbi:hypothetical protein D3C73_1576600 [compost metagenome]